MGFIQAFRGALGGMLADQWRDFLTVPDGLAPTAALFPAVPRGQNAGRGSNTRASENVITVGSKILVPEGYGLITLQDGKATGLITEAGGYEWQGGDVDSQSVFAGEWVAPTVGMSWERFKFGGRPTSQQIAVFVNLKEIPNNRFGTQSEIYWDDAYLNTQVGAVTRGTYTLRIVDPLLFLHNFVPAVYYSANSPVFDFGDMDNDAGTQLFNEVVSSLASAFSNYTNDPDKANRITRIQSDTVGFAQSLGAAVEQDYRWTTDRGLAIVKVAIQSIEYDERTRELLTDVQKADALGGNRSASFLNQSVARGVEAAGQQGGGGNLGMFGMGAGMVGGMVQPVQPIPGPAQGQGQQAGAQQGGAQNGGQQAAAPAEDPVAKLAQYKQMLDQGLITEEDYEAAKKNALGL
ncbi:MAG: SPFH domain-containing protein [Brachybacterium sp.]|nr:SPFH domain-containing protein [Brachybacterium sp.]